MTIKIDRHPKVSNIVCICIYRYINAPYIANAYGDSPPPLVFGVWLSNKRQELSGTFLAVRGRPEEPEKKTEQWMEVFMTFLLLAGCTVVTLDALRHVLGGCVFYEFGMCQE